VSKAYLDDLAFKSASMDERLQILTSASFNIKIPFECYQLAHLLVQVVRQTAEAIHAKMKGHS
jgi:hypothetical protein